MILGLILALMTAAAVFAVIWPLAWRVGGTRSGSDIAIHRDQLDAALKELDGANAATPAPGPGPSAAQKMGAAGAPPNHQQGAMIQNMVERLAERLKASGSDPDGWLILARSYATLGEKDKATAAVSNARQALADDPDRLEQFNEALKHFDVGE